MNSNYSGVQCSGYNINIVECIYMQVRHQSHASIAALVLVWLCSVSNICNLTSQCGGCSDCRKGTEAILKC